MKWLKCTIIAMILGIMTTPWTQLAMLGSMSCCGGSDFFQFIPAWPAWPVILLVRALLDIPNSLWLFIGISAIGYGLLPTYFLILRALWRKLWKPCHSQ